ncbi:hypothetical protein BOX15_Mlig003187g1 [Macrostomum lignano]|uniref:Gluconokinase n=1 Tax=Macrostomum lignano TaxID=282301 RepID=A0A267FAQ0_9PLAT|nr:hypothetical protein BOX15_Mlig003187g1 [Macrostomum lignano]
MPVFIVMGPSGCGKTSIAAAMASHFRLPYAEADDFHSEASQSKMRRGEPLTDADRLPWLLELHRRVADWLAAGQDAVITCSALKRSYRRLLMTGRTDEASAVSTDADASAVLFIHLAVPRETLLARVAARRGHFFPAGLVESQLACLEPPDPAEEPAVLVDADRPEPAVLQAVIGAVAQRLQPHRF